MLSDDIKTRSSLEYISGFILDGSSKTKKSDLFFEKIVDHERQISNLVKELPAEIKEEISLKQGQLNNLYFEEGMKAGFILASDLIR